MSAPAARHRDVPGLWSGAVVELADLVLARGCAGCGTGRTRWCPACARHLGDPPHRRDLGPLPVWSSAVYAGPVQTALVAWKDRDRPDLTRVLAAALARAARCAVSELAADGVGEPAAAVGLVIVPAPSSASARRTRGRHPVRDLARGAATGLRRRGIAARVLPVLRQRPGVRDQSGLDAHDRAANLSGALWVPPGWRGRLLGRPCLIVDDVVTTGATLVEAARALRDAGAGPVVAATVAATELRRPPDRAVVRRAD
ncbi:MAG: phosphoribosyltransferase family protein [Actinomycetota bacterium]